MGISDDFFTIIFFFKTNPRSRDRFLTVKALGLTKPSNYGIYMSLGKQSELTDSKMAPFSPMFPLGVTPNPPIRPAHRSLQMLTQTSWMMHTLS